MEEENKGSTVETISEYMARIEKDLNVIKFEFDPEVESVLRATQKERYGWDAQKCLQNAYDLKKYESYLGNLVADLNNRLDWFDRNMRILQGKYAKTYGGDFEKFENRCVQMEADNDKAIYLAKKIGEVKAQKTILNQQYYAVRDFIRILEALGKVKNESQRS
jgi:hypothetical protein